MIFTERERERGRDTGRGRSRLHALEPDVGFDPGSPGSRPGPKAGAKPLRHPGIPRFIYDRERERQRLAEGEAGSMLGARCGT